MSITFNKLTVYDETQLQKYANLRPIFISERQFINQLIWQEYYETKYYCNDQYLMYITDRNDQLIPMMPFCKLEDIPTVFSEIKEHWNKNLGIPLNMMLIDKPFIDALKEIPGFEEEFEVIDDRNAYDYIYDAEKLRKLSGKAYHKKKNHLNKFLKGYKDRYQYRTIDCRNMNDLEVFHQRWLKYRGFEDIHDTIRSEDFGVKKVFENCYEVECKFGGVFVDGVLEAFSIGTYDPAIECAFIHTEKANSTIPGLYNFINQQFLINEFPDAKIVNREDDLGQAGLRKSKISYRPIRLEEKFQLKQRK